jgi:hypothetical protein
MPEPRSAPAIVVAGDVCIDWVSIPIESVVPRPDGPPPMNWQLRGGRHMHALRGGAWLTADLVEAAVGEAARVGKPAPVADLRNVPPDEIIHSMLTLAPCGGPPGARRSSHWAVERYDGYAGPPPGEEPKILPVDAHDDDAAAAVVVLDDAGNGFRDFDGAWPGALARERRPLVLYKVRRPLASGALWKRIEAFHLDRTVALLAADELRGEGAHVGRRLSWERTATDLVLALAGDPGLEGLRGCPFLVVPFGIEGVVLLRCVERRVAGAHLWYLPERTEGELVGGERVQMSGFGSVLAAALAAALVETTSGGSAVPREALEAALGRGVRRGVAAMRALLDDGFGPCSDGDGRRTPAYPLREVFAVDRPAGERLCDVAVPALPRALSGDEVERFRNWRILDSWRTSSFAEIAARVARRGVAEVFADVPVGRFGRLETVDRSEIESYRAIANLLAEFLRDPRPPRPLCLAVFGPPGSGKSFGVNEVARSLSKRIEKVELNVSQWHEPRYLVDALHRVRDFALRDIVPLVFFDEFDSNVDGQWLGWLKYFLAPMQDGVFADGLQTHQIGKAVFVFAGGTAASFQDFRAHVGKKPEDEVKSAKLPDFLSRLRGYVNVHGFGSPLDTNLIRRAIVLRAVLLGRERRLEDAAGTVRIDDAVLRAFLFVRAYEHGARSLQAIVEMSNLVGRSEFDPSLLPPRQQLDVHVDAAEFLRLVERHRELGAEIEALARELHASYLSHALAKGARLGERPALQPWEELDEIYRISNREQAANIEQLFAAVGGEVVPTSQASPPLELDEAKLEALARLEHDRWVEERRIRQPDHPSLAPWDELPDGEKEKDFEAVRAMPELLAKVGLGLRRAH